MGYVDNWMYVLLRSTGEEILKVECFRLLGTRDIMVQ